jgi:hypothetical protein
MRNTLCRPLFLVALLLSVTAAAEGRQDPTASAVPPGSEGRRHAVRLSSGQEVTGRLLQIGPAQLRLLADGREWNFPLTDVDRIDRMGDSLINGAIVGALAAGVMCAIVCGQGLDSTGQLPAVVAGNTLVGALIGLGIDAANQKRTTVYQRPARAGRHTAGGVTFLRLRF